MIEKYVRKGTKLEIIGRLKSGSYAKGDGSKVYYKRIAVEELEFAESKAAANANRETEPQPAPDDGFMQIPEGMDGEMPFN